ncbi:MAG TPA: MFS transporter [Streptosporangiaceae bacterium]|nr:MFS transporter [Streptosporangiaceae bacterium]
MAVTDGSGAGSGHHGGLVGFAGGFRAPFSRYWLSGFLSDFGNGVRLAGFPLLVAQLTREPEAVAAVTAVQGLPWLLLGTGAGVIADRVDRRRLIVTVDTARAAVIAGLAAAVLIHEAGLVLIYVAAFLVGTGAALRGTAAVACVPRLVEPADLDKANGRVIAGQIVGYELAGPAAGGWLFGMAAVLPFAVNAGTLGIAVLLLLTLPGVFAPPPRQREPGPGRARFSSVRHDLGEALGWMRRDPAIRDITLMAGVVAAMDATWFAVLVLYVIKVLHQQPGTYGLLLAIGAVGGILAGSGGAALTRRIGPWRSLLLSGLGIAATQAGLGLTGNVIVAAVLLMLSSAVFALCDMTMVTMLQRDVPDALLGRVSSVFGTVMQGGAALGAITGGILAAAAGIRAPMLAGAVPIAVVTVFTGWRHRAGENRGYR